MRTPSNSAPADSGRSDVVEPPLSLDLMPEVERRKLLSSSRLRIVLTTFVVSLVLALAVLTMGLIAHIFGQLNPTIRQDLVAKAVQAAPDIASAADLGILVGDAVVVRKTFERYRQDRDIVAIVVWDAAGNVIATHGAPPLPAGKLLSGPPNTLGVAPDVFYAWAEAVVEGRPAGRVAVVVSTQRLDAGEHLQRRIMVTLGIGCVVGLFLSLFFVRFYIVPLIRLTQRAFERLQEAALAMVAKQRLERELEIGARIQTCILPKRIFVPGLEVAAHMRPATEVGGDYYDIMPAPDGCWVGIGDVAGHGLTSGLVMLMAQSAISALVDRTSSLTPREVLCEANYMLYENIRNRLGQDEFVTLSLLRFHRDGRVTYAGAHEDMLVFRARHGHCEIIETQGVWLGVRAEIAEQTHDRDLQLEDGDVVVLYTDGITEAMNHAQEQYGLPRLAALVERHGRRPAREMIDTILGEIDAWMAEQNDDLTVLAIRYQATPGSTPVPPT